MQSINERWRVPQQCVQTVSPDGGGSMSEPSVAALCLYDESREKFLRTVLDSFELQDYENKWLVVYDTSEVRGSPGDISLRPSSSRIVWMSDPAGTGKPVGTLRNRALSMVSSDIVCHFDSDDWSHCRRITEQVNLLKRSGADVVGYNEALFFDVEKKRNKAWIYSNPNKKYALGASLCYWTRVWRQLPFFDTNIGEDTAFLLERKVVGVSGLYSDNELFVPRMVCRIHGSNVNAQGYREVLTGMCSEFTRTPSWDSYCKEKTK
jgi:hypothetical protein